ncbi:peptide chain release factor 1 [Oxalobacter aliiformigenes]|uniref:Peptide chain release factor 1 n=1 Tax=Oxalobacter aliiformigenes TaxID=2946593 RepID=A0A9E9LCN1_9BURK|nr:peptide chain release factor 1 [Oxalobacter aliiformigenes]WAV90746.1 peptide chain release factor 1 [Oxalobacter aliiformigenes]
MKPSMLAKLEHLSERLAEIDELLMQPEVVSDQENYRRLNREHAELAPVVALYKDFSQVQQDVETAREMLSDPEMKEFAQQEINEAEEKLAGIENDLQVMLLPKDPNDGKNIFLEIRAGTGGDESALFAGDLLRMYTRFAEKNRWKVEVVSASMSELGGYREVIVRLVGRDVYSRLKFESGGHRVQRVPVTETQGRIHTSACTVAVMPEADDVSDVHINPADIRIDTFRASGAGGQHINKTDSAVRITHLPTGIVVECQDDRSQHKNKAQAMLVLASRIKDKQLREQQAKEAATRKNLIGSGDRSERIRTYNYPQGRVTDHRINLTLYKLEFIMDGDLDELVNALAAEHRAELLAEMAENV